MRAPPAMPFVRIAAPLALFAALTALVAVRFAPLLRFDGSLSAAAREFALAHPAWRTLMSAVTHTGDTAVQVSLAALLLLGLLLRRDRAGVVFLLATTLTARAVRVGVLLLVHRARPEARLTAATGFAYPSGHTTSSAVTAGIIVMLGSAILSGRWSRAALVAVAGTWAALVGVSRAALLAHWPSDVVGGWLLAATVLLGFAFVLHTPTHPQRDARQSQGAVQNLQDGPDSHSSADSDP